NPTLDRRSRGVAGAPVAAAAGMLRALEVAAPVNAAMEEEPDEPPPHPLVRRAASPGQPGARGDLRPSASSRAQESGPPEPGDQAQARRFAPRSRIRAPGQRPHGGRRAQFPA